MEAHPRTDTGLNGWAFYLSSRPLRYVPNLIPKQHHVDIDPPVPGPVESTPNILLKVANYFAAILFFLGFLATAFHRPGQGVIALFLALLFLPQVHRKIEELLRFKFTWMIKTALIVILALALGSASSTYDKLYQEKAARARADSIQVAENNLRIQKEREKKQQKLNDTLNYFRTAASLKIQQHKYSAAVALLTQGLTLNPNDQDFLVTRADARFKAGAYSNALDDYSQLISAAGGNSERYFQRASCYLKLGSKGNAIGDLKQAMNYGNATAEKLYNKINPLKRRVIGYITRCCDGSSSNAKGRGACSHHHGVCDWNEPIYQEYRDFE